MPVSREARTLSGCDIGRIIDHPFGVGEIRQVQHKPGIVSIAYRDINGRFDSYDLNPIDTVTVSGVDQ